MDSGKAERLARQARIAAMQQKQATAAPAAAGAAGGGAAAAAGAQKKSSGGGMVAAVVAALGTVAVLYAVVDIRKNPDGQLAQLYRDSWLGEKMSDLSSVYQPSSEKLLPTYEKGSFYGDIPPGAPPPPLLVLDLERTLIGSEYDAKYGWRHVRRPGLQRFLDRVTQYYEVVIVSENEVGDLHMAIDPDNKIHKHGPSSMEVRRDTMLKRLDLMNRDLGRIVLVDDSPEASSLFPRNTLLVKPFVDVHDRSVSQSVSQSLRLPLPSACLPACASPLSD